jgi:hypothetical protein
MQRTEGGVPPATAPTVQHPTPTVADAAPGTEARRLVWLSGRCACVRPSCGCHGFEVRVIHPNETWHLVLSMYPYFAFRQPLLSCERSPDNLLTAQAISSAQRWRRGVDSPDWAWATLLSIDLLARGSSQSSWRRRQLPLRPKHRTETGETQGDAMIFDRVRLLALSPWYPAVTEQSDSPCKSWRHTAPNTPISNRWSWYKEPKRELRLHGFS